MLDLVLQLGPCRIEPVGRRLLRVRGGSDRPEVVAAIRRAGGEPDGTRQFWWMEARNLRGLADELRRAADPLFHTGPEEELLRLPASPRPPTGQAVRRPLRSR